MKKRFKIYLAVFIVLFLYYTLSFFNFFKKEHLVTEANVRVLKFFTFDKENSLREWEEKIFKGKVVYNIEHDKGNFVKGESIKTASALYYKIKMDPLKHPVISWKWNVKKFPKKEKPERIDLRESDDFAARVYVIFPAAFFLNSKVLEYVWAEYAPEGAIVASPYSKNIQLFVLKSGLGKSDEFQYEKRNIYEDYIKAFGNPPKLQIGAIAFMTDADSTNSEAIGEYADIKLAYEIDSSEKKYQPSP